MVKALKWLATNDTNGSKYIMNNEQFTDFDHSGKVCRIGPCLMDNVERESFFAAAINLYFNFLYLCQVDDVGAVVVVDCCS